jgi:hypothetical protein
VTAADVCTLASHARDKRTLAPTLIYKGDQLDEHGKLELVYLHCILCASTLAVEPAEYSARYQEQAA